MKRVIIVRHGKSVHYGYEDDFNRDLSPRGLKDADIVSKDLAAKNIVADIMISSPAKRALKTARIFAKNLQFNLNDIIEEPEIYEGLSTNEFFDKIRQLPTKATTVFFFGHNPGFYYLVTNLLSSFYGDMPTTSTVAIDFDVDLWTDIKSQKGQLAFQLTPKMFK